MTSPQDLADRVDQLRQAYTDIGGPTSDQWERLLSIPTDRPVTLINFFAFRDGAGSEAFSDYAAVSGPALEAVGGRFVHLGNVQGALVGTDETWDLVVVGEYPSLEALLALHEDPAYQEAYRRRVEACARQRVLVSA